MQGRDWQFYIISGNGRRETRGKITKVSVSGVWLKIRKKIWEAMIAEVILQKVDQQARITILCEMLGPLRNGQSVEDPSNHVFSQMQ